MNFLSIFPIPVKYYVRMKQVSGALILALLFTFAASAAETVFFKEEFAHLDNWKPVYFPKISRHSVYTVVKNSSGTMLKLASRSSASALVMKNSFDVYRYPALRWRWKVDNVYRTGNGMEKRTDDYPIRIYVLFTFDESSASVWELLKYRSHRLIYGEYPPHSSLIYAWGSTETGSMYASPYTDKARVILKEKGSGKAGQWVDEHADIPADYVRAFGTKPPATAVIGIMNDSDNTGESSVSYLKFLELSGREGG